MNEAKRAFVYGMAQSSLKHNIVKTEDGFFLRAGAHQFSSFWTRDFCWAALGLLGIGELECSKNHLNWLLTHLNDESLVARLAEHGSSKRLVLLHTVFRFLPSQLKKISISRRLRPEYLGEHRTPSQDSNLLVILVAFQIAKYDPAFLEDHKETILKVFSYYELHKRNGLIWQQKLSDWQDSAHRCGHTFYLNILYWRAAHLLVQKGWLNLDIERLRKSIIDRFFQKETGLFKSHSSLNCISLDGNLLALDWGFLSADDSLKLYNSLKMHPTWQKSYCTYPCYPRNEVSWTTKTVGLRHYHDEMIWSWLLGKSLKVARKFNDLKESDRLLDLLYDWLKRDGSVYEIYSPDTGRYFSSWLYQSEHPFSWGAGVILESLEKQTGV